MSHISKIKMCDSWHLTEVWLEKDPLTVEGENRRSGRSDRMLHKKVVSKLIFADLALMLTGGQANVGCFSKACECVCVFVF